GMILVTGPTGSGKTTTLYAMLRSINAVEKNVITVENPVEYRLERINQIQVNPDAGTSFAAALRAILRQDPDVVMVGEIRDLETAEIAVQAALTGHLVLSTLHTNDAATAITRLRELGLPAYLLSSCVALTIAQRLIRRICPDCGESAEPDTELLASLNISPNAADQSFKRGAGCTYCQHSGYRGRQAVFEILPVDHRIQQAILDDASAQDIKRIAVDAGMHTLLDAAALKMTQGLTTPEEVQRVIAAEGS
ncbi:GspE/PulE family protein, partial [Planctomycetota bacterium]